MPKLFAIVFCTAALFLTGVFHEVEATPGRSQPCSNCHSLNSAVTVTVSLVRCSGSDAEYEISVSDTFSGGEGWAIFDGGSNIRNGNGSGTFTVPGDVAYDAWGVSNGSGFGGSDLTAIGPDCAVSTCNDFDSDGYYAEDNCGSSVDCDDNDMAVNPGVAEDCTDGIDNDCDGLIDATDPDAVNCPPECTDGDSDAYSLEGGDCGPVDCDDLDSSINPGATENCIDGFDNDCNGLIDAADPDAVNCPPECTDLDSDGYFAQGGSCGPTDCDDSDPLVNPGESEDCANALDDDCDGLTDGDDTDCGACYPTGRKEKGRRCSDGFDNDCDGAIDGADPDCGNGGAAAEVCDDGIDNDNDRKIDCADRRDCGKYPSCRRARGNSR